MPPTYRFHETNVGLLSPYDVGTEKCLAELGLLRQVLAIINRDESRLRDGLSPAIVAQVLRTNFDQNHIDFSRSRVMGELCLETEE